MQQPLANGQGHFHTIEVSADDGQVGRVVPIPGTQVRQCFLPAGQKPADWACAHAVLGQPGDGIGGLQAGVDRQEVKANGIAIVELCLALGQVQGGQSAEL